MTNHFNFHVLYFKAPKQTTRKVTINKFCNVCLSENKYSYHLINDKQSLKLHITCYLF